MLDMAGYFGLNILLWAGIVTLASPPTQPPAAPQCSYTLKPIKFGFRLTIRSSTTAGLYILTLRDQNDITTTKSLNKTSSYILNLKPCTSYRHRLSLTLQHGVIDCDQTENTTATLQLKMEDFQNVQSSPGHICYQSKWNIRSLLTQHNNMQLPNNNIFCIRYDLKDICTNFTTNVPTSCGSFPFTKFINLDPSHITMRPLDVYPAEIETTLPPNCKNWTVEHVVCSEMGSPHQNKSLTELEPYTDYSCAANVTHGTVSMRTQDINIRIDCNLIIYECSKSNVLTNTSMNLHWNLKSSVCKDLFTQFNFSYDCYCDNDVKGSKDVPIKSQQVSCSFSALDAFKDYTCGINVKYKKFSVLDRVFLYRTEPGIPERPPRLHLEVHDHNQITVKVHKISRFNGPSEFYIVCLYEGKTHKETRKGTKRSFVFKDLSYSTEYTVQASTFNGHFESSPYIITTSTCYNEPALINFLIFLIIVTSVALILVAYKIYTRRRKRSR